MEEKTFNIGKRPAIDFIKEKLGTGIVGAEIGVNKGHNALYICNIIQPKILYLIDPWNNFFDPGSGEIIGETQYIATKKLLEPFSCCRFIKKTSYEANKEFTDTFFDFVYIDADHTYNAVLSDMVGWYPKVKKGGILSGHDFSIISIDKAVKLFCQKTRIDKLYVQNNEDWWLKKECGGE